MADTEKRWLAKCERDTIIEEQATGVYEDLWREVLTLMTEARSNPRFAGLEPNGRQLAHTITLHRDQSSPAIFVPPRTIEIALQKSKHEISVSGATAGINMHFDIDICDSDGSACLKIDGHEIKNEEAARRILSEFLYPGLPYVAPVGKASDYLRTGEPSGGLKVPRITGV